MNTDKTNFPLKAATNVATIVFGLPATDPKISRLVNPDDKIARGDCRDLTAEMLTHVALVICTLFPMPQDQYNDAVSVVDTLVELGFRGDVVVLAPPLLRPKMVESELRSISIGMTLRLLAGALPPLTEV